MYYSGLSSRRRKPAGNQMSQAGYDGRLGSELQCFFCNEHAESGCRIDIRITPANDGKITTNVSVSGCDESISRVTMIRRK